MKNLILICILLFPLFLSAQNGKVQVVDKKEGNITVLTGKNKTDTDVEVEIKLTSQGLGLPRIKTLKDTIPANSDKEVIRLAPEPGKKWSYSFEYSYRPQAKPTLAEQPSAAQDQLFSNDGKITVFTKNGCGRCDATVD